MTQEPNPHEALAAIRDARMSLGKTLDYPFGWDILYGLILALMVGGSGLPQPWSALTLLLSLGALLLMIRWWRAKVGWWVNGYSPPMARWVAIGLAAILFGLMGLSMWTRFGDGPWWAPVLSAALAFVLGIVGGRLWMHVFRKEMARQDR